MNRTSTPQMWLLILIIGLPQLSETVYSPSLPDISAYLQVSNAMVEYTLSIYLAGFAIGTLFWGNLSDRLGRKPCLLIGLALYVLGCVGCYSSTTITALMISRFIQAFGGSTGSVIGQALCRDAFHGPKMGKAFAVIGSAIAFSPVVGPILGGSIDQFWGWSAIFLVLICAGVVVLITSGLALNETHHDRGSALRYFKQVFYQLSKDHKVIGHGVMIGACNGIAFSYYAEGSFYLIELLGMSPALYGLSFALIALSGVGGGLFAKKLHDCFSSDQIIEKGIRLILTGSGLFFLLTLLLSYLKVAEGYFIGLTLLSMMFIMLGIAFVVPNTLAVALADYRYAVGTASSLFGFFYYVLISLFTIGMGMLHDNTLLPMPLYFLFIGGIMAFTRRALIQRT